MSTPAPPTSIHLAGEDGTGHVAGQIHHNAPGRGADAFICLSPDHDRIPLQARAFDSAINLTLGLPVARTSVDHGTAFDIAWLGKASANSLITAVERAARLAPEKSS